MNNCLFCKIIAGEIPAARMYEDDHAIVIKDINPQAPLHCLAIPREHYAGVHQVPDANSELFSGLFAAVARVVAQEGLEQKGYRLVVNYGDTAGQTVPHIHVHILSGRPLHWPPG